MQYLFIICHDALFAPTEALIADVVAWTQEQEKRGIRIHGNPLRPADEAATIRVRNGKLIRKAGPFASSRKAICAYELVECTSFEEAVQLASRHPMAKVATIEIRPVWSERSAPVRRASANRGGSTKK